MDFPTILIRLVDILAWPVVVMYFVGVFSESLNKLIEVKIVSGMHKSIKQGLDDGRSIRIPSREN